MSDEQDDEIADEIADDVDHDEQVRQMYELHRDLGRAAMKKALAVLNALDVKDIPVNTAVQLLKFGAELERRAVLGIEPEKADDPFATLAAAMEGLPGA